MLSTQTIIDIIADNRICNIGKQIKVLGVKHRANVLLLLTDEKLDTIFIYNRLTEAGLQTAISSLRQHRTNVCACRNQPKEG